MKKVKDVLTSFILVPQIPFPDCSSSSIVGGMSDKAGS